MTGADINQFFETRRGTLLAGTVAGIDRLEPGAQRWTRTLVHSLSPEDFYRTALNLWSFAHAGGDTIHARASGKVFRSSDDGRTWAFLGNASAFATLEDGSLVLFRDLERSVDGGETWEPSNLRSVSRLVDLGGGRLLAATWRDSLFASADTGRTWRSVAAINSAWNQPMVVIDAMTVLRGGREGVHRSTDAGHTWQTLWTMPTWDLARGPGEELVAAVLDPNTARRSNGVHRSTDAGRTWSQVLVGTVRAVSVSSGGEIWAAAHPKVYRSSDGGATWQRHESGLHERTAWLWNAGAGQFMAIARGHIPSAGINVWLRELFRSDDGGASWRPVFDSLAAVIRDESGSVVAVTAVTETYDSLPLQRTYVSVDQGAHWTDLGPGKVTDVDDNGRSMMAVSVGTIRISTDRGATWKESHIKYGTTDGVAITPSGRIFAGAWGSLYRSDDTGRTWRAVFDALRTYSIFATSDDVIATIGRDDFDQGELYVTTNGGDEWVKRWFDGNPGSVYADTAGNLIVFTGKGTKWMFASTDGGLTWSQRDSSGVHQLGPGGDFYRFHEGRLELSADLGRRWLTLDTGRQLSRWLSAATDGDRILGTRLHEGVFRAARPSSIAALPTPVSRPLVLTPIPGRRAVRIELALSEQRVLVVDMHGDVVLETSVASDGRATTVDVSHLPSGVYLLQVWGAEGARTGRFVVRQ